MSNASRATVDIPLQGPLVPGNKVAIRQ